MMKIAETVSYTHLDVYKRQNFDTPLGPWKVCYQTFEPMSYIDQGFKITVNDGNKTITKELNKKD